jgi:pimeloyl-ACP methyl ester carboxylesterase
MSHVVILIPGIMGSVLKLGDEVIWPGSLASLAFPYGKMRELLDPDLQATDCIRSYILPQYQQLIDDLEACNFQEAAQTLVICAYDWRKSIETATKTLAQRTEEAVERHGPDVEISLLAHSMGGLLCRYFLESGKFETNPGWKCVRRLITMATPHRGAAIAIRMVLGLEKELFLNADQVLQLSSSPLFPSAYQLLPWRSEPIAWDSSGKNIPLFDIYDPKVRD